MLENVLIFWRIWLFSMTCPSTGICCKYSCLSDLKLTVIVLLFVRM